MRRLGPGETVLIGDHQYEDGRFDKILEETFFPVGVNASSFLRYSFYRPDKMLLKYKENLLKE